MESADGSKSLLAASDQMFDNVCGPCKTEGNVKEARQYCGDCLEYLCDKCVKYHIKLALTKNHNIVPADTASTGTGRRLTLFCTCSKNQEIHLYCEDHGEVICGPCKQFKHHKCQTIPIQHKSSGHTASKIGSIMTRAKALRDKYDHLKQECSASETELKHSKEICKKEIKAFRKELDDFLDKLERDMLTELDQVEVEENQQIEKQIAILTTALQMLDKNCQLLNDAINDGRRETMFVADLRTSKELSDYESRLIELEKEVHHISLSFKKNKKLGGLQREIKIFGSLSKSTKVVMQKEKTVLLGRQIQSRKEVKVSLTGDEREPWISGCTVMPNGNVVICDYWNNKIKLLDNSLAITQSLELSRPRDVSVFDPSNVIVTLRDQQKLQFVEVFPALKLGRVIQLDRACWGVHVAADAIYVTCHNYTQGKQAGEVKVFDKQGNFIRRLGGSLLAPSYITLSTSGNKVFVSDAASNTITCMTVDGSIIYQYKDKDLQFPRGIYCDDEDNVMVCSYGSNNVQLITADGKNHGTLLSKSDGLKWPCMITFRKTDNMLIVGCYGLDHILVYNLTK